MPLEYTGDPVEKLMGFLMAVVFVAFYLGIVNLLLMFGALTFFANPQIAYGASFILIAPFWFYATYRARRYVLARTRWRGIRFGLTPGAWGYAWRAMLWWVITIFTIGIAWPVKAFMLERYITNHTHYGDRTFTQGGRWWLLFRPMIPLYLSALLIVGAVSYSVYIFDSFDITETSGDPLNIPFEYGQIVGGFLMQALPAIALCVLFFIYAFAHWRTHSYRRLMENRHLGAAGFIAKPRSWRVALIYLLGNLATYLSFAIAAVLIVFVVGIMLGFSGATDWMFRADDVPDVFTRNLLIVIGLIGYFFFFLLFAVFHHVYVAMPLWRHFAASLTVTGAASLDTIQQRERDEFAEAEGFAEAFDIGGAI